MVGHDQEIAIADKEDEVTLGTDRVEDHFQDLDHIPVIQGDHDLEIMVLGIDPSRETERSEAGVVAEGTTMIKGVVNLERHLQIKKQGDVSIANASVI